MLRREDVLDQLDGVFGRFGRLTRKPWAKAMELTFGQYALLKHLYLQGRMTMGDLANELDITMAGATGMVDRLLQVGLVERYRSEQDRRLVHVDLSAKGRQKIQQLQETRQQYIRSLLIPLSDDELVTLHDLLSRVAEAGEKTQ